MTTTNIRSFMKTCALIAAVILPSASFATSQVSLFTATSDAFDGSLKVSLEVDENTNATAIVYNISEDTVFPIGNLPKGIVIYQTSGKNIVTLSSKTFNDSTGGPITMTYLQDGISGTYATFNFSLARQGQGWEAVVTDKNGIPQKFTTMYLTANKFLGNVIGIDSVSVK